MRIWATIFTVRQPVRGELTCLSLATDQEQMLLRNVLGMVASGTGKRVAYTRMNSNNMELYVADLQESQARNGSLTIANARVVYTGVNLNAPRVEPGGQQAADFGSG